MANKSLMIRKPDALGGVILMLLNSVLHGRSRSRGFFVDDEGPLKIDPHRAWRGDGAVDGGFPARSCLERTPRIREHRDIGEWG